MQFSVNSVVLELLNGSTVVATSSVDDYESPSSVSLVYRETVSSDSTFTFQIKSSSTDTILAKGM